MPNINLQRTDPNAAARAGQVGVATPDISTVQKGILSGAAQALGAKGQDKQKLAESIFNFGRAVAGFGQTVGGILGEEAQRTLRAETSLDFAALSLYAQRKGQELIDSIIGGKTYNTQEELLKDANGPIREFVKNMSAEAIAGKTDVKTEPDKAPPIRHAKEMGITADCVAIQQFEQDIAKGITYQLCTQFQKEQTQYNMAVEATWQNQQLNNAKVDPNGDFDEEFITQLATHYRSLCLSEDGVQAHVDAFKHEARKVILGKEVGDYIDRVPSAYRDLFKFYKANSRWDVAAKIAASNAIEGLNGSYNKKNVEKLLKESHDSLSDWNTVNEILARAESQVKARIAQTQAIHTAELYSAANAIFFNHGVTADGQQIDLSDVSYAEMNKLANPTIDAPRVETNNNASKSKSTDSTSEPIANNNILEATNNTSGSDQAVKNGEININGRYISAQLRVAEGVKPILLSISDKTYVPENLPDDATVSILLKDNNGTTTYTGTFNDIKDQMLFDLGFHVKNDYAGLDTLCHAQVLAGLLLPENQKQIVISYAQNRVNYINALNDKSTTRPSDAEIELRLGNFLKEKGEVSNDVNFLSMFSRDAIKKNVIDVNLAMQLALWKQALTMVPQQDEQGRDLWGPILESAYSNYKTGRTEYALSHHFVNAAFNAFWNNGKLQTPIFYNLEPKYKTTRVNYGGSAAITGAGMLPMSLVARDSYYMTSTQTNSEETIAVRKINTEESPKITKELQERIDKQPK